MRTLPPTDPESPRREPPVYLQGALRAAAAARARTARIRAGALAPSHSPEEPFAAEAPAHEGMEEFAAVLEGEAYAALRASAEAPGAAPSDPGPRSRARQLSFTRTVAAAHEARSAVASEGAADPWHLCLRAETDTGEGSWRWLSRLLKPWSLRRRPPAPAPDLLSLGYDAAAAIQRPGAPASHLAAGEDHAPLQGTWPHAGPPSLARQGLEPAAPEVLRLPRLRQGRFDPEGLPSGRPNHPGAPRRAAGWQSAPQPGAGARLPPPRPARPAPDDMRRRWHRFAESWTRSPAGPAALAAHWRLRLNGADAAVGGGSIASAPRRQAVVSSMPTESGMQRLPAIVQRAALPSLRHLAYEAGRASGRGGSGSSRPGARPAPSADRRVARRRLARRLATLGFAIVGGFGLGIVANGGALVTGSKLGEAMLALETHVLSRGAEPPWAGIEPQPGGPAPHAGASGRIRPSFSAAGLTAAGGPVADPSASAEGGTTAGAAAGAQAAAPAAAAAPSAGPGARDAGARDRNRFAAAHATAPAADPTGWEALYAKGHRFQLQGNLVAAADAYRRAIRLNPHHPAMLYDLGYVLQMQGQSGAAMDVYRRTIALEPDHAYAHYNLGYLLQEQGDSAAASHHYEIAAARLPGNPYIYYDWAWSLETVGDLAGAAALYRKAIEIDPDRRPGSDARRRLAALGLPARPE